LSRLSLHTTTSCNAGEAAASTASRKDPTLTHVPVVSLKSSAVRPSKMRPRAGSSGSANPDGVSRSIEAFIVVARSGQIGTLPIARRNVRSAHANLELTGIGHQLQLHPRHRHADIARTFEKEMGGRCQRRSLGRTPR